MKLLLIKEVEGLGAPGDLVNVSAGYARNFLLPRNLAAEPTPQALRRVEAERRRASRDAERLKKEGEQIARTLENCSVNIPARTGEGGHLFGSVSVADIVEALAKDGRKVEESWLRLERPIKEVGIYDVPVFVHGEQRATVKVWVVEEKKQD
ncbi:MAG: 50S ribosomal protein L9 [Planctomycetaceae bacterium]|nr:50S ribosomal protein L9 [Planctomycetota bacterium]NUN51691.1 50S ribosomal protein L9 [Planctomycetaceae bacterium]